MSMNFNAYTGELLENVQLRLRAMEEENTKLRNTVITCNDEIYSLRAVAVTVEAELKYNTEMELAKMESELKFRSKELAALSRDHEKVLKEFAQYKQRVAPIRAVEKNSVVDTTTDAAFDDTMDRQSAYSQPIGGTQSVGPVGNNNSSKTSETIAASTLTNAAIQPTVGIQAAVRVHLRSTSNAHIDSISNNSNSGSTAAVSPRPASAPVRDKATTTASLFDAQELKHGRAMFLSSIYQQLLASLVASANSKALPGSVSMAVEMFVGVFSAFQESVDGGGGSIISVVYSLLVLSQSLLEHAQLHCIGDISSQQQQQQLLEPQYLSGQLSPLQHSVTLLEVLLRLLPTPAAAAGWGEDRAGEDIAAVVGNLQNKFDLAATAKTGPAVGAKAAVNVDHSASCGSVQPRWTQSIKTPAITAAHRAAAWMPTVRRSTSTPFSACSTASEAKFKSKSGEGLTQGTLPSLAAVKLCFHHCALFMSQLLVFCGELSHKDASSSSSDFLLRSVCAAGHVYQREASVVIKPCRSADSGSGSTAGGSHGDEATRCELSTLCGIVGILQSRTSFVVRCEAYKTLSGFLTGSPKNFRALTAMHISPAEPNFTSPLRLLIQQLSVSEKECALSLESERETMLRKFQVVLVLMSLLQKYRGAFVLLLLGVNHEPHAGSGGRSKGSSASVSSTESAASLDNPIAKKRPLPPQEGEGAGSVCVGVESGSLALAHVTPLHSRKLVKGMGPRSELQQRDSQSNRITPGSHGSVGTGGTGGTSRSHRKVTPVAVAVLDLKDKLTSVDKSLVAQLVTAWMHHIRMLDDYSVQWKGSGRESDLIRLVRLLSIFLSETLDYFTPSDCDVVVNDVTDVFYEYIYRGNTGSWHPALQMQDSLFSFLEYGRQQFESSA